MAKRARYLLVAGLLGCGGSELDVAQLAPGAGDQTLEKTTSFTCAEGAPAGPSFPAFEMGTGPLPAATGGVIPDGSYITKNVRIFGDFSAVPASRIEFENGSFFRNQTIFLASSGAPLTGASAAGAYELSGTSMKLEGSVCNVAGNPELAETAEYSVAGDQLTLITHSGDLTQVEIYIREP